MQIELRAYAKVNLDLRLQGRRSDGYHDLCTVFQSVGLCDHIVCERIDGPLVLDCDAPGVPTDGGNLAWKAAEAVWRALGRDGAPVGMRIVLRKGIPSQAGLGGGSADAAAVVVAAQRVWQVELPPDRMAQVLSALGADVPFLVQGGTMLGVGRGDVVVDLPMLPSYRVVVAVPPTGVSTPEAYRWFDERHPDGRGSRAVSWPTTTAAWPSWLGRCVNDFEEVVIERCPQVGDILSRMNRFAALLARMSGSGSAVFGLFADERAASAAAADLRGQGLRVLETTTLGRAAVARGLGR